MGATNNMTTLMKGGVKAKAIGYSNGTYIFKKAAK